MTGTELSAALAEKLKVLLPDCAVRPAFTGTLQRLPQRAAVTVGVMQEENADGVFETVLGVQLYARERDDHARLFDAVCAAVSSLPCALRSVKRSETTYSAALSCLVTLCTVQAATGAADNARAAVVIGDKVFTADAVKISHEAKVKRYSPSARKIRMRRWRAKRCTRLCCTGFRAARRRSPANSHCKQAVRGTRTAF